MNGGDECGSMSVMAIGIAMVVFAVAGLVVDGTKAFIDKRALQSAADAASVSAATELDVSLYYRSGGTAVRLDPLRAQAAVGRVLARRGLDARHRVSLDDRSVELVLTTETETTLLRMVGIDAIPVSVSSRAEPFPQSP